MKYFILLFIMLSGISFLAAQTEYKSKIDSLYDEFIRMKTTTAGEISGLQSVKPSDVKCGFGIISQIKTNYSFFNSIQKKTIDSLLTRPSSDTSFVTPGGYFRIHFTKSDFPNYIPNNIINTIPNNLLQKYKVIYLDSLAIAFDSAYNFEINFLGYPPPPPDGNAGGDNLYDIYIIRMTDYGETVPETDIGQGKYTSYMNIADNYSDFYTDGINGARVTAAHEFHHAIQMGNYILRYDLDGFFYELTSVSMEHFVFGTIHDYYQYLPSYFRNTQTSFSQNGGLQQYALGIWNIFMKDNFGFDIIKKQWELMPKMRAMQAIQNSLTDYNSSFGTEFSDFGLWTYFTNYRSFRGKYFKDAQAYPLLKASMTAQLTSSPVDIKGFTAPLTNTFISIVKSPSNSQLQPDSLAIMLTNSDIQKGIDSNYASVGFEYILYPSQTDGSKKLTDTYFYNFSTQQPAFWLTGAILNNQVIDSINNAIISSDYAYPSPYYYKNNYSLYLPVSNNPSGYAQLNIYSISMRLVYSSLKQINSDAGKKVLVWNALDKNNARLSTGIYFYIIKSGDTIEKGKLVIFNE